MATKYQRGLFGAREIAISEGRQTYKSDKPCIRGHWSERAVSNRRCVECWRLAYEARDREAALKKQREHRQKNIERNRERSRDYARRNAEANRARAARWARENPAKMVAWNQLRRARRRKAAPPWLTKEDKAAIAAFYVMARRVGECTGIPFDVDHIEPLGGKSACGLHVPWNLRLMPRRANQVKNRRTDAEVYGHD